MQEYNISSFLKILHSGVPSLTQGPLGILVFESIASRDDVQVTIGDKKVSNLIQRKDDVPNPIQVSSTKSDTIAEVTVHFHDNILPLLNPHMKEDVFHNILRCINNDTSVPVKKYEELNQFLEQSDESAFLSRAFLYAINRSNKLSKSEPSINDYPLLEEVNHRCPICQKKLLRRSKGKLLRQYNIVPIFPENLSRDEKLEYREHVEPTKSLDSSQNQIPLCLNHANEYLTVPTIDTYVILSKAKEEGSQLMASQDALSELSLETNIKELIDALETNISSTNIEPLNMDALKIDKKILPENLTLRFSIQRDVLTFFLFIKALFAEVSDFEYIQSDINRAFKKLDEAGLSQLDIVNQLTQWILDKASLGEEHRLASHIIVSYFIQNCEVFYEITE
ncbi:TPA: ABC-three component system protein [Streptococcus suis]